MLKVDFKIRREEELFCDSCKDIITEEEYSFMISISEEDENIYLCENCGIKLNNYLVVTPGDMCANI